MEQFRFRLVRNKRVLAGLLLAACWPSSFWEAKACHGWSCLRPPTSSRPVPPCSSPLPRPRSTASVPMVTSSRSARSARERQVQQPIHASANWSKPISRRWAARSTNNRGGGRTPRRSSRSLFVNLIGSWHPERTERIVIGAHYDTRPHPDEEVDPQRFAMPFIGANDGASGVALLMEIAHHLEQARYPVGRRPRSIRRRRDRLWQQADDRRVFPGLEGICPDLPGTDRRKRHSRHVTPRASCSTWSADEISSFPKTHTAWSTRRNW